MSALYEQQWDQIQMDCAKAWANLDIAIEMVETNKEELTEEQYAEVQRKIEEQQKYIQDTLLKGKVDYDEAVKKYGGTNDVRATGAEHS